MPQAIPALALFQRDIEEHGFDIAIVQLRKLDIGTTLVRREVGRIDVR